MSIYAIGVVREQSGEVKLRLIAPDKLKCIDIPMNDIQFYMSKNEGIKNLGYNKKGELQWKQGSAERYPIIDMISGTVKNNNSVIVLGVADTGTQKYYKICNYLGQITTVKANDLIEYGKIHGISNCKIVKKGNTEYISAIEGSLEELDTKPKFKIDTDLSCMIIHIPFLISDELVIPEVINGRPIFDIESIKVTPESSALSIKKLTMSKYIKKIVIGLFTSLRNLEEINILGDGVTVYDNTFTLLPNLRKVHFKSIKDSGANIFSGLKNLEEVECDKPMSYINSGTFLNCPIFKVESILKEGVRLIGTKAFAGNKMTQHLVIPSTITNITDNAFEKNKALEDVDVKTEILQINTNSRGESKGLFAELGKINMYVNKNCIIDEDKVASNVNIIRREASIRDKLVDRQIQKSNILGVSLEVDKIIRKPSEIADALITAPQREITNAIQDLINMKLHDERAWRIGQEYNLSGFKVHLELGGCPGLYTAKKMRDIGKYIVLTGKNIIFYPVDRELLRHYLLTKCYEYSPEIRPAYAESKYLKSVDIGNDGSIRLIYEKNMQRSIKYIKDFALEN